MLIITSLFIPWHTIAIKYFPVKLLSQGQMTIIQDSDESLLLLAFHLVVSDFNVFL